MTEKNVLLVTNHQHLPLRKHHGSTVFISEALQSLLHLGGLVSLHSFTQSSHRTKEALKIETETP